jgi:hypothetical protein
VDDEAGLRRKKEEEQGGEMEWIRFEVQVQVEMMRLTAQVAVEIMNKVIREPVVFPSTDGDMYVQIRACGRIVPKRVSLVGGDGNRLSGFEDPGPAFDEVGELTGEDVESLGLVVVVVVRWGRRGVSPRALA